MLATLLHDIQNWLIKAVVGGKSVVMNVKITGWIVVGRRALIHNNTVIVSLPDANNPEGYSSYCGAIWALPGALVTVTDNVIVQQERDDETAIEDPKVL